MLTTLPLPVSFSVPNYREIAARAERALENAFARATGPASPPRLEQAIRHALFPGGGRLRPQLCLVAAIAGGDHDPEAADSASAAVEMIHCASLVHDDMPCFDDAAERRGRPSVHKAFGEATALLVGDALIVHAFAELARAANAGPMVSTLAEAAGAVRGLIAGQAWESEPAVSIDEYHRAKTASLFEAAAALGALSTGVAPAPWRLFGERIGRIYQTADDISDIAGDAATLGKPVGQDRALGRPNVAHLHGLAGARSRAARQLREALDVVPSGPLETLVRAWVERFASRAGI